MNAVELYLLGRKLMKIAEATFPNAGAGAPATSVRMILIDVAEHPDSSIGEITTRTGFPQSHVSASVARLRELGALHTSVDQDDGRRTLVRVAPGTRRRARRAALPIDRPLSAALGSPESDELEVVCAALDALAARLIPGAVTGVGSESSTRTLPARDLTPAAAVSISDHGEPTTGAGGARIRGGV